MVNTYSAPLHAHARAPARALDLSLSLSQHTYMHTLSPTQHRWAQQKEEQPQRPRAQKMQQQQKRIALLSPLPPPCLRLLGAQRELRKPPQIANRPWKLLRRLLCGGDACVSCCAHTMCA